MAVNKSQSTYSLERPGGGLDVADQDIATFDRTFAKGAREFIRQEKEIEKRNDPPEDPAFDADGRSTFIGG